jgi:cytochrome c oxidase subunit 7c
MHIEQKGIPGSNLPFDIRNRYKLTAVFVIYFASGLAAPFILVRHQLLKD